MRIKADACTADSLETRHFLGLCDRCDALRVVQSSLGKVEDWYRTGRVGQVVFEAYMHVWATSAPRYSGARRWLD